MAINSDLVWDFYRLNENASGLGLVAHQYDEMGQSIYLNQGLRTQLALVDGGDWENAEFGNELIISDLLYSLTAWDQPFQNLLIGAAVLDDKLYFLRYDWLTSLLTDHLPDPNEEGG